MSKKILVTALLVFLLFSGMVLAAPTVDVENQADWDQSGVDNFNGTSADRADNSGNVGLGYENGTSSDNLFFYGQLEEESTGTIKDYSGNNNDGSTNGFSNSQMGQPGFLSSKNPHFDGSDTYIDGIGDFNTDSDYSVSAVIRFTGPIDGSGDHVIMTKFDGSFDGTDLRLGSTGPGNVKFATLSDSNNCLATTGDNVIEANKTYHVVGTWDEATGTGKIYVNGTEFGSATCSIGDSQDGGGDLTIGEIDDTSPGSGSKWRGKIDEVRIYTDKLSQEEIRDLYFYGRPDGQFDGSYNRTDFVGNDEFPDVARIQANIKNDASVDVNFTSNASEHQYVDLQNGTNNYTLSNFATTNVDLTADFNYSSTNETQTASIDSYKIFSGQVNKAPNISNHSFTPRRPFQDQDLISVFANVSDPDGDPISSVTLDVEEDGTTIVSGASMTDHDGDGLFNDTDSFTVDESEVWYNTTVTATDSNGNTETSENNTFVDFTAPRLKIQQPTDKNRTKTGIPLNYTVSDAQLDSCFFNVDGQTNTTIPNCANTTFNVSTIGRHTVNLYSNDSSGNLNKTTTQFTAYQTNQLDLEDSNGNQIDSFSVTFTNSTTSKGGGTSTNSKYLFNTSTIPFGTTTMTIKATGFDQKDVTLQVNKSFEYNQTETMQKAEFILTVQDEQTEKFIAANITISNGTTIKRIGSHYRKELPGTPAGVNNNVKVDFFGQNITATQISIDGEVCCNSVTASFSVESITFIDGTTDNNPSCSISKSVGSSGAGTSIEESCSYSNPKIVESLVYSSDNLEGDGSSHADIILSNEGEVQGNIESLLKNASMPKGDVDISLEKFGYRPRTFQTQINLFQTIDLDTYLLQSGEGLFMNIEVRDPDGNTLPNATINVQKQFGLNYVTVAQGITASSGTATFYLDPDVKYRAVVTKPGFKQFKGTFNPSNYQFDPLIIQLGTTGTFQFSNIWSSVAYDFYPDNRTLTPENHTINFTIADSESGLGDWGLILYNETGAEIRRNTVSGSPSGGTTSITQNMSLVGDTLQARGFFEKNGTTQYINKTYLIRPEIPVGQYSIKQAINDFEQNTEPGTQFFIAIIIVLAVATFSTTQFGGIGGAIPPFAVLGVFAWIQWIPRIAFVLTFIAVAGSYMIRR